MLLQMQGFFKDMNAICKFWTLDSLCYKQWLFCVLCLEKNDMKVLLLVQKW